MSLPAGTKLGSYEVIAPLGAGGMGEVYRARDARLNREVALKVLLPAVASDPDRLARFAREAQLLAVLNHTNIAHVHGLEEASSAGAGQPAVRALVMELVEGPTLADVIATRRAGLPLDEVLAIAKQIVDALDAAHEQGIVHRDLKPANIKVRSDGTVKVLDFGLAKAIDTADGSRQAADGRANSPTISLHATQAGMILGTAAYMSPEQARGRAVDKRADIWAFGCVLYEMLTGTMAFGDEDVSLTLSKVLQLEPDWNALPASTPPPLVNLLKRCLRKDPRERLRDIGDARSELQRETTPPTPVAAAAPRAQRSFALVAAGAIAGLMVGAAATRVLFRATVNPVAPPGVTRLSISLPATESLWVMSYPGSSIAISPDGLEIIYAGAPRGSRLRRRRLDSREVQTIPETDGAQQPFFSPDGEWLGFFTQDGFLKKMPARGGRPIAVVRDLPGAGWLSGSWSDNGQIVFDNFGNHLSIVSADGANRRELTQSTEELHIAPAVLPGSKTTLFTASTGEELRIDAVDLDGTNRRTVLPNASNASYLASGHLLFVRDGDVMVVPFDRERVAVAGPAISLGLSVVFDLVNDGAPVPQLAVAPNGTLVYALPSSEASNHSTLEWVDRSGRRLDSFTLPFRLPYFELSPDDSKLAIMGRRGGLARITILDFAGNAFTDVAGLKLDFPSMPVWTPGGRELVYAKGSQYQAELWAHRLDRAAADREILKTKGMFWSPGTVSPDGRHLVYMIADPVSTLSDLRVIDLQGSDAARDRPLFPSANANERNPAISPDGKWIAYTSDESGGPALYVQRFPEGGNKRRVSIELGEGAQWSADGRELFFTADDLSTTVQAMVVDVRPGPEISFGPARVLFESQFVSGIDMGRTWAVSRDGKRFLLLRGESALGRSSELVVVQNWFEELRRLAPASR